MHIKIGKFSGHGVAQLRANSASASHAGCGALAGFPPMPARALLNARHEPGRMFTARAAMSATVTNDTAACTAKSTFDQRESGIVSVGENAVEFVNETYR